MFCVFFTILSFISLIEYENSELPYWPEYKLALNVSRTAKT
jgi:hypothetical protein